MSVSSSVSRPTSTGLTLRLITIPGCQRYTPNAR